MIKRKVFSVIGGDQRQAHLANILAGKSMDDEVYAMFFDDSVKLSARIHRSDDIRLVLPQSDVVIFPLPMFDAHGMLNTPLSNEQVTLEQCLEYISMDSTILGGMVPDAAHEFACSRNLNIMDYLQREEFSVLNAVPSALAKMP